MTQRLPRSAHGIRVAGCLLAQQRIGIEFLVGRGMLQPNLFQIDIPTAFWRSVGPSHNVFVTESFMDDRGFIYENKGDYDRALADLNEAIRLDPKNAAALCGRGMLKRKIDDSSGDADIAEAKQLDASACR